MEQDNNFWSDDPLILEDDKNYLIAYKKSNGDFSLPHRAYWDAENSYFFSLESCYSFPLKAGVWMPLPKTPKGCDVKPK